MCEFQRSTYECRGDGYIWDADFDGYDPEDKSWACPNCNTKQYLLNAKEEAESVSYYRDMCSQGSGVTIWEGAVVVANYWNQKAAEQALIAIGCVSALFDDEKGEDGVSIREFNYA